MDKTEKLKALWELENENNQTGIVKNNVNEINSDLKPELPEEFSANSTDPTELSETTESNINSNDSETVYKIPATVPSYNTVDGYRILERNQLPYGGRLYPESWNFTFRCPSTDEVANFSTIQDGDAARIQEEMSTLIRKCYVIIDSETGNQISSGELNDGDRLFFFLKLREYYMEDMPIEFPIISVNHQEPLQVTLMAHNLIFEPIKEKLLECYDGRKWTIPVPNQNPIIFLNPTFELAGRIFKYMKNKYQEAADTNTKDIGKKEFNKKFLLLLPFLYETGNEKIESLYFKFTQITNNEQLMKAYLVLATKMIHQNQEYINIEYKGDQEKTQIKFPSGWKGMFIDKKLFADLF